MMQSFIQDPLHLVPTFYLQSPLHPSLRMILLPVASMHSCCLRLTSLCIPFSLHSVGAGMVRAGQVQSTPIQTQVTEVCQCQHQTKFQTLPSGPSKAQMAHLPQTFAKDTKLLDSVKSDMLEPNTMIRPQLPQSE